MARPEVHIVTVNKPIERKRQDIFHLDTQIAELKRAIDKDANFIGIISEYGGGKSSLVRTFARKKHYKLCNICLWGYEGKGKIGKEEGEKGTSIFTQTFLYQFARIVTPKRFAGNINRMMSKNYRAISWSSDISVPKWCLLIILAMLYAGVAFAGNIYTNEKELADKAGADTSYVEVENGNSESDVIEADEKEERLLAWNSAEWRNICKIAAAGKDFARISAIVLALLICNTNHLVFSWKDDTNGRELGEVDTYEIFEKIVRRAKRGRKKYVINIEDLDRFSDQDEINEFLKTLYKYNNLLSDSERARFIFMISMTNTAVLGKNKNFMALSDKIFDYIMVLRPIGEKDRKELLKELLENQDKKTKEMLEKVMGENWNGAPAEWITKGGNLGIREMKSRLNKALAIHDGIDGKGEASFCKCCIVAYLESVYPVAAYHLLASEDAKRKLKALIGLRKVGGDEYKKNKLQEEMNNCYGMDENFVNEIQTIFPELMTEQDCWLYFHRMFEKKKD